LADSVSTLLFEGQDMQATTLVAGDDHFVAGQGTASQVRISMECS
jgi:hypothetical protein